MKRRAVSICACGLLAALSAPSASFGFAAGFDYVGQVKGDPGTSVGFIVKRPADGPKRVKRFTVTQIPYQCGDASPGVTGGWELEPGMRVEARTFAGSGDWIGLPLDPVGKVSGTLGPGGAASGDFKLRGELAGPGTHCRTGLLQWRATKIPF